MAVKAKELREKRAKLITEARAFLDQHSAKAEDWTADREGVYNKMLDDASKMKTQAEGIERLEKEEGELATRLETTERQQVESGSERKDAAVKRTIKIREGAGANRRYVERPTGRRGEAQYVAAFSQAMGEGAESLSPEQYAALRSEKDDAGGYLVASEEFAGGLLQAVDDILFIRQHATIHTVRESKSLGIRSRSARLSTFAWSSELATPTADTALKFGKKVLSPHHLTGECLISRDLLRVAVMDPAMIVAQEMSRDAGEVQEDAFLLGNGANKPLGVFVASADGINTDRDVATGNTSTAIGADGLREAKYSLKMQHRALARWLFHRTAIGKISKLKDGDGQYLWRPGISDADPDRLLGLPVDESERAPSTFTTGLYVGLLANWRYYEIADGLDLEMQRLDELHARSNQVGFIGRLKCDGMPTLGEAFARVTLA